MLTAVQLWHSLFAEPFPEVPITLKGDSTAVIITTLLAAIWARRYPVWEDKSLLRQVGHLIDHVQHEAAWQGAALSALAVAGLDVYLTLGVRFAQYFPDNKTWTADVSALDETSLAAGIETFLTAVNEQYFPVEEEVWVDELEYLAGRLEVIDLLPAGYDLDPDFADLDQHPEPVRTCLILAAAELNACFPGLAVEEEMDELPLIDLDSLSEIIPTMPLPEPIRDGLPVLLDMVRHTTGNVWLDFSYSALAQGGIVLPEWEPDNVTWLRQEWQAAQALIEVERQLINWVTADEPTRLPAVRSAVFLAYINKRNLFYAPCDRTGSCDYQHLSRSHHPGKSADRWLSYRPSYLSG